MFNRLFSSVLIVTSAFTIAFGQNEKKDDDNKAPRAFAFSFGGGSWLGVQTDQITKDNFSKYSLSGVRGVAVEKVSENSPASAAGILAGDVILKFDGEEVTGVGKLNRLVSEVDPDHQVRITISRGGREQEITATIAKRPETKFYDGSFNFPGTPDFKMPDMQAMPRFREMPQPKDFPNLPKGQLMPDMPNAPQVWTFPDGGEGRSFILRPGEGRVIGVSVESLSKQLAQHFRVDGGVMISEVREGSPAAKAGLRAGDIITQIDGKNVKDQVDIMRGVNNKKDGDVTVTFVRDGRQQTVDVTPEKSKNSGFFFNTNDEDNG